MTRDEFIKRKWKAYEVVEFNHPRNGITEMMLISIDYDCETLGLVPIDLEFYEQKTYHWHIKFITIPRPKLKLTKK